MKKYLPFLILFCVITLITFSTYKISKAPENNEKTAVSGKKISDFELVDLFVENQKFSQENLTKQYSIINFFASWCTTCKAEHQILMRLKNNPRLNLYGIAWRDISDNTKKFLAENGNPFKQVASDPKSILGNIINLQAVPETIVVNPQGEIIARYRGKLDEEIIAEIYQIIK